MKNYSQILVTAFFIAFLSACSIPTSTVSPTQSMPISPSNDTTNYFPLSLGAYWVYEGPVKWTAPGASDVTEENIRWKMEVLRVVQRGNVTGYQIKGAPWDLAWYDEGKEPGDYAIIQVGTGTFYKTTLENLQRLEDPGDGLIDLVKENEIFLDTPLIEGKRFCEASSITRSDGAYCWIVGQESEVDLTSIHGLGPGGKWFEYPIVQSTLPDSSVIYFTPGVGITWYTYVHHGTVAQCDLRLVEYHPGNK